MAASCPLQVDPQSSDSALTLRPFSTFQLPKQIPEILSLMANLVISEELAFVDCVGQSCKPFRELLWGLFGVCLRQASISQLSAQRRWLLYSPP